MREMKEMVQEDRGGAAAPIARCSAEKEPQAVEKPGLACSKSTQQTTVRRGEEQLEGDRTCRQRGGGCMRVGGG